jgi:hypothetical protein
MAAALVSKVFLYTIGIHPYTFGFTGDFVVPIRGLGM